MMSEADGVVVAGLRMKAFCGECDGVHPHGHHDWEVEWADSCNNAYGLANGVDVYPA